VSINFRRSPDSAASADMVPALTTARLVLPKIGVAYLFVMLLSVFNRVMINELKIAAALVGLMYLTYNAMNILQVSTGRFADRRAWFGYRRTPMMIVGLMISALALLPLPHAAVAFSRGDSLALVGMFLCMAGFGIGFAMNGDSQNTLIAELTEGKRNRPGVVSAVWLFQLVAIVASGIVTSILLQSAEIAAGAAKDCTTAACQAIRSQVAIDMMPRFFLAGPIVCLIGLLGVLGLEKRIQLDQVRMLQARPALNLRQAYTRIFRNEQTRVFFFFIVTSIFGLFLQDNILEPFGADVFALPASATARFQSTMGGATILAMLIVGIFASRRPIAKRTIANFGAAVSAAGFVSLMLSALLGLEPLLYAGMIILGVGMGAFNIGALSMMMDMTIPGEAGSLMGAWGMAQALANGWGQFVGGAMRDVGISLTGNFALSYSAIFAVSVTMCVIAINLMARVDVQRFRSMTREQLGMTLGEA
jgi:BCD family chlorophyll transporter-like MFS transporter